jgi:archaellum component FlaC
MMDIQDQIENACDDLRCALIDVVDNGGDAEEVERAKEFIAQIETLLTTIGQDAS